MAKENVKEMVKITVAGVKITVVGIVGALALLSSIFVTDVKAESVNLAQISKTIIDELETVKASDLQAKTDVEDNLVWFSTAASIGQYYNNSDLSEKDILILAKLYDGSKNKKSALKNICELFGFEIVDVPATGAITVATIIRSVERMNPAILAWTENAKKRVAIVRGYDEVGVYLISSQEKQEKHITWEILDTLENLELRITVPVDKNILATE